MKLNQWLVAAGVAAAMCLGANSLLAQNNSNNNNGGRQGRGGRGNFDPAAMQQRIMDNLKTTLEVTDDAEWKVMQPLVQKVMDIRRESIGRGMFGRGGPRGGDNAQPSDQGQQRGGMGGTTSPEKDALQKAVDSKASKAELKAALDKYVASRTSRLAQAQADLRKVLTTRQEAIATLNGLL